MIASKSVLVTGNSQNDLSYICYPVNEFSTGKWQMSINALSYETEENLSLTCSLTCNFVTGKIRTKNSDIKIVEVMQ